MTQHFFRLNINNLLSILLVYKLNLKYNLHIIIIFYFIQNSLYLLSKTLILLNLCARIKMYFSLFKYFTEFSENKIIYA
jgi:hypothetical protein